MAGAMNGLEMSTTIEIVYATHDHAMSMMGHCQVRIMLGFRPLCLSKSWAPFSSEGIIASPAVRPKRTGHELVKLSKYCARATRYMLYFAESQGSSATFSVLYGHILWKNMIC